MDSEEEEQGFRFKGYFVSLSGEYPVVSKVTTRKTGKNVGEEIVTPIYFPRDIKGAFRILERITATDTSRECKQLKDCHKLLQENHKELLKKLEEVCSG